RDPDVRPRLEDEALDVVAVALKLAEDLGIQRRRRLGHWAHRGEHRLAKIRSAALPFGARGGRAIVGTQRLALGQPELIEARRIGGVGHNILRLVQLPLRSRARFSRATRTESGRNLRRSLLAPYMAICRSSVLLTCEYSSRAIRKIVSRPGSRVRFISDI